MYVQPPAVIVLQVYNSASVYQLYARETHEEINERLQHVSATIYILFSQLITCFQAISSKLLLHSVVNANE